MYRLHFLTLMLAFLLPVQGYSVTDSTTRLQYNLENALPSNNVYSVMQDRSGYLWFCTDNGLVKYNGYTFKTFNAEDGLPTNDIWRLYEDRYGRIWFYCYTNEIGYLKNDAYHKVNIRVPDVRLITNIKERKGKVVLLGRFNRSLWTCLVDSLDEANGIFFGKDTWPVLVGVFNNEAIANIQGQFHAVSADNYKMKYKRLYSFIGYSDRASTSAVPHYLRNGLLLVYANELDAVKTYDVYRQVWNSFKLQGYGGDRGEKLYTIEFTDSTVMLYSNKAIYYLDLSLNLIKRLAFAQLTDKKLFFSNYMTDNIGNGWISTNSAGCFMLTRYKMFLKHDSLIDKPGVRPIGTLGNDYNCWWNSITKQCFVTGLDGKIVFSKNWNDELRAVANIDTNRWLFAFQEGLIEYNHNTRRYQSLFKNRKGYVRYLSDSEKQGYSVIPEPRTLLDEKTDGGLEAILSIARYGKSGFISSNLDQQVVLIEITDTVVNVEGIAGGKYPSVCSNISDIPMLYNKKEVLLIDLPNSRSHKVGGRILNWLKAKTISGIYADRYLNIYLHIDNRLIVYNMFTRWATEIRVGVDIGDAHIRIHNDKVILSGAFGLGYIQIYGPLSFGGVHTVPNIKKNWYNKVHNLVVNNAGRINILTDKGAFYCNVNDLVKESSIAEDNKEDIIKLAISKPYIRAVNTNDTVLFEAGVQSFTFDVINFYGSGERYFAYYVEGVSKLQQTATGEILITNLRAGRYYNIKCRVRDEMRQSKIFSFYIYKQPYWYETTTWNRLFWLFGILVIAGLVILTVAITRYYVNRANEKKGKLLDLELRAVYSQINPHFIFNTLSSALFFINKKQMDDAYIHVSKFSKLLRSYLKSSQERYVTLTEEIAMLRNYIELQQIRFEEEFEYVIDVDNKIPADSIKIPSLLLQPLVENAINHGLFHKKGTGHLSIKFQQGSSFDELICIIEDDGVGRMKAAEINKESTVKWDSYGTRLTQRLIEIFKEYEHMDIYLDYMDKKAPDTGTIVKLTLKNLKYDAPDRNVG